MDAETLVKVKVDLYRRLGVEAYQEDKFDEAIDYYNKVLELAPHFAEAYRERGAAYYAKGDKENAERDMQAYFRENPKAVEELSGKFNAEGRE